MLLLTKLYPEQIARQWGAISPAIEAALPPITVPADAYTMSRMNRVFMAILAGRLHVYVFHTDEAVIKGIASFNVIDPIDGSGKQLFIYSVYGVEGLPSKDLLDGIALIKDLARGLGCVSVVGYTAVDGIKELVARVGGDTSLTFLRMEV